ncbi:MAG: hypothetical protein MR950_14235, partial [Phocaeicola vulgatus]|nr:hypothetical protein [Phocaeicola vulgatus]
TGIKLVISVQNYSTNSDVKFVYHFFLNITAFALLVSDFSITVIAESIILVTSYGGIMGISAPFRQD